MRSKTGRLNDWLDSLPRPSLFRACRPRPAFGSLGVTGYHAALIVTVGCGLFQVGSLLVLLALSGVCAASFYGWALLRRRIAGRESYVAFEHVWVALLASAGAASLFGAPVLASLDAVSLGLATFLAFGRIGCLSAGCCHGLPSSVGVVYGHEHARQGFSRHLVGVRLFPVQILETLGLFAIVLIGVLALSASSPGRVLVWVLFAYSVLRFGLESLRGDERPHLLGLSQARWMALAQAAAATALVERAAPMTPSRWAAVGVVASAVVAFVIVQARAARTRARLASAAHAEEVRALVRSVANKPSPSQVTLPPAVRRTKLGASVGVSFLAEGGAPHVHVSLLLPLATADLEVACALAARALPEARSASAQASPASLFHVVVPCPLADDPAPRDDLAEALFGAVVRFVQAGSAPHESGAVVQVDRAPSALDSPPAALEEAQAPAPSDGAPSPDPSTATAPETPAEAPAPATSAEEEAESGDLAKRPGAPAWSAPAFEEQAKQRPVRWARRAAPSEPPSRA